MRIAMVGGRGIPASYGGVEMALEAVSTRLAQRGHEVVVYCRPHYVDSRITEYQGVRLVSLPSLNTKHLEAATHSAIAAVHATMSAADIVHFHGTGPSLFSFVARARKRVVVTVQGLDYRRGKWGPVAKAVLRLGAIASVRVPHATIVVSKTLQSEYRTLFGAETIYVPNGYAELEAVPRREGDRYALFLGRLVPEKGVHYLIKAFLAARPPGRLVIAGPSSHSDAYVQELRELADRERSIEFVGPVYGEEKASLVRSAHVFCQPSDLEGLPLALLEAMAAGVCAIVSDIPEHLEVVGGGKEAAALVFRRGDVADLASQLAFAFRNDAVIGAHAAAGEEVVRSNYDWDSIVDSIEGVYADVLRRRPLRRRHTR